MCPKEVWDGTNYYVVVSSVCYVTRALYPSVQISHNICYSTLIMDKSKLHLLNPDQYTSTPDKDKDGNPKEVHYFVKEEVLKGVVPIIVGGLLQARAVAKKFMNEATDPFQKDVGNCRQKAVKVVANSVYGFTVTNI